MNKVCPLTQTVIQQGYRCQNTDCYFLVSGGCAIVKAAKASDESERILKKIETMVQSLRSHMR